jgi:hypothetical protein
MRGECGGGLGVAVELGEMAANEHGRGRDIDQVTGRHTGRRLERLIAPAGRRILNGVKERFHDLEVAAGGSHEGLRRQQPGRDLTTSAGRTDSHRWMVAASPRML